MSSIYCPILQILPYTPVSTHQKNNLPMFDLYTPEILATIIMAALPQWTVIITASGLIQTPCNYSKMTNKKKKKKMKNGGFHGIALLSAGARSLSFCTTVFLLAFVFKSLACCQVGA